MRFVLIVLFICSVGVFCSAQNRVEKFDFVLDELRREESFSGNILVAEKGKIIYAKSFGYADAETKTPLTDDSIFLIGSVAKTLTAAAVLKLKERGKLNLDDAVTKYLPELSYKNVTLRRLLSHTSGLLEYQSPEIIREIAGKGASNAELVKLFARLNPKLGFEPGSKWNYSNTNYILLALVVEKASGMSFPEFVKKNIFAPAGMTRSFVGIGGIPEPLKKEIAAGYRFTNPLADTPVNVETLEGARRAFATKRNLYGAGNVFSSTLVQIRHAHCVRRQRYSRRPNLMHFLQIGNSYQNNHNQKQEIKL